MPVPMDVNWIFITDIIIYLVYHHPNNKHILNSPKYMILFSTKPWFLGVSFISGGRVFLHWIEVESISNYMLFQSISQ